MELSTNSSLISFSSLTHRYGITQSSVSNRVSKLGLKLAKRGRNKYLSISQLAKMDELDAFLQENPFKSIADFLDIDNPERKTLDSPRISDNLSMDSVDTSTSMHQYIDDVISNRLKSVGLDVEGRTSSKSIRLLLGIKGSIDTLLNEVETLKEDNQRLRDELDSKDESSMELIKALISQIVQTTYERQQADSNQEIRIKLKDLKPTDIHRSYTGEVFAKVDMRFEELHRLVIDSQAY